MSIADADYREGIYTRRVSVRPFVIGRKNWLFSTSPKGADASSVAYSIINTAQANEIDVKDYLTNIFRTGERRLPLKSE